MVKKGGGLLVPTAQMFRKNDLPIKYVKTYLRIDGKKEDLRMDNEVVVQAVSKEIRLINSFDLNSCRPAGASSRDATMKTGRGISLSRSSSSPCRETTAEANF